MALLIFAVVGQAISGVARFNGQQLVDGAQQYSMWRYVRSSSFAVDLAENWQSEYLQFALYIVATTWLSSGGRASRKNPTTSAPARTRTRRSAGMPIRIRPSGPAPEVGGAALYGRSLAALMTFFFLGSMLAQSIAGRAAFNVELLDRRQDPFSWWGYVTSSDYWNRTFQNWQSEFLAVASMAVFAIYLRQRGSPESKLVGAPHHATDEDA